MASLNGLTNFFPFSLNGLQNINAATINGNPIYTGNVSISFTSALLPTFTYNSTTNTIILNLPYSSLVDSGILSNSDFMLFTNKENTLTFSSPLLRTLNNITIPYLTIAQNSTTLANNVIGNNIINPSHSNINVIGNNITSLYNNSTYINNIRNASLSSMLYYDASTKEISYSSIPSNTLIFNYPLNLSGSTVSIPNFRINDGGSTNNNTNIGQGTWDTFGTPTGNNNIVIGRLSMDGLNNNNFRNVALGALNGRDGITYQDTNILGNSNSNNWYSSNSNIFGYNNNNFPSTPQTLDFNNIIGSSNDSRHSNINIIGSNIMTVAANSTYINNIRNLLSSKVLYYNPATLEITYEDLNLPAGIAYLNPTASPQIFTGYNRFSGTLELGQAPSAAVFGPNITCFPNLFPAGGTSPPPFLVLGAGFIQIIEKYDFPQASASSFGWLSQADWNHFNSFSTHSNLQQVLTAGNTSTGLNLDLTNGILLASSIKTDVIGSNTVSTINVLNDLFLFPSIALKYLGEVLIKNLTSTIIETTSSGTVLNLNPSKIALPSIPSATKPHILYYDTTSKEVSYGFSVSGVGFTNMLTLGSNFASSNGVAFNSTAVGINAIERILTQGFQHTQNVNCGTTLDTANKRFNINITGRYKIEMTLSILTSGSSYTSLTRLRVNGSVNNLSGFIISESGTTLGAPWYGQISMTTQYNFDAGDYFDFITTNIASSTLRNGSSIVVTRIE